MTKTVKRKMDSGNPSIISYYENRSIFITGATGFVGKVLLEKLLRSFPGIGFIYVLIRPAKGKSANERLEKLLESSIFNLLREEHREDLFQKIIPIPGDITSDGLGIIPADRQILSDNVSVVFHVAATVKFNEPLLVALNMNLEGTRHVIELSKTMRKISSIVYVSTAYSNAHLEGSRIEEKVYPAPMSPYSCTEFISRLDQTKMLPEITPILLGNRPNTYVLSKHLAEVLVEQEAERWNLPICIVRPSIIAPIHKDPSILEGWTDNINAIGIVINGIGSGLHHITYGDPSISLDVIPVDYVVKIIILAGWETGTRAEAEAEAEAEGHKNRDGKGQNSSRGVRVYNACIDQFNRVTQGHFNQSVYRAVCKTPFSRVVTPPSVKMSTRWWWSSLDSLAAGLPCTLMDMAGRLNGQNPRMKLIYERSKKAFRSIMFFRAAKFEFVSNNVKALRSKIPSGEKRIFDLGMEELNWKDYAASCVLGVRRYFYKDDDSTLPVAAKNLTRLRVIYAVIGTVIPLLIMLPFVTAAHSKLLIV